MATYSVTTSNWNSLAFWSGINQETAGHILDFSGLGAEFSIDVYQATGVVTITDGITTFTVGEAGVTGTDANFGGATLLDYFTTVSGTQGNDIVDGTADDDVLDGNAGDDVLWGDLGDDTIYGNGGADDLYGADGNDLIYGGAGDDEIVGGGGDDRLFGETGNDTLVGGPGADTIYGGAGADLILGGAGDDNLEGGWEDDAADTIEGNEGNDLIFGYGGGDSLLGGTGDDWIDGGAGDDYIEGGADQDRIVGDLGNDTIFGGAGYDILTGGEGADLIYGGDDADAIWGNGGDTIFGGEGGDDNDTLYVSYVDFISYTTAENGTITFNSGDTLSFYGIEQIVELTPDGVVDGTAGADQIGQFYFDADGEWIDNGDAIGEGDGDSVRAGDGDDTVWAHEGDDTVHGEGGDDYIDLGSGNNVAFGGAGADTIDGGWQNDTISGDDFVATGPNLIVNGSFEDTTGATPIFYGYEASDGSIAGWTDENGFALNIQNDARGGLDATDGDFWIDLESDIGQHNIITQNVAGVTDGNVYILSFDLGDISDINDGTVDDNQMQVIWNGDVVGTIDAVDGAWRSYEFHLIGGSGDGTNTLTFAGLGGADAYGASLDNVQMYATTEAAGGDDRLAGWEGDDDLIGGAGNDTLDGGDGADMIVAGSGNDSVLGGHGNDTIWGGTGDDTIDAGADNDIVWGGEGNDNILGGDGNDTLSGNAGADTIDGGMGADSLSGGQGGDSIAGGGGGDFILGDGEWLDPADHSSYAFSPATTLTVINSADGPIELWWFNDTGVLEFYDTIQPGDTYVQPTFESHNWVLLDEHGHYLELIEGAANQTVNYGAEGLNDSIDGGGGSDTIYGQFGDDTIDGGDGADLIYGGSGNDSIFGGKYDDTIFGGTGNDTINVGGGSDLAYGEDGDDLLIDGSVGAGATTLYGGDGNDTIQSGTGNANALYYGDAGDDRFEDRGGNNQTYDGGAGSDTFAILSGIGNDTIIGGEDPGDADTDLIDLSALGDGVTVNFTGDEAGTITNGSNTLTFSEIEQVILTDAADVVDATADPNGVSIDAAGGDDTVTGSAGDDTITGGAGADSIAGGDGNDVLYGGNGPEGPNLIADGSFEGATPSSWGQVSLLSDWYSWNNSSPDLAAEGGYEPGTSNLAAPTDGTNYVSMVSNGGNFVEGISQDLATPLLAGVTYTIQLDAAAGGYNNTAPLGDPLQLLLYGNETPGQVGNSNFALPPGATLLGSVEVNTAYTSGTMETVSITFTPTTDIATLSISLQDADFNGIFAMLTIDNVGLWEGDAPDEGNDTIDGGAGDDTIFGGDGDDSLRGGEEDDTLYGGRDDDSLWGDEGDDLLYGDEGDDVLEGGMGNDTLYGGTGNDTLDGSEGEDLLFGGEGNDLVMGGDGDDSLYGGEGDDTLWGGDDRDTFVLEDGYGANEIAGGEGGDDWDVIDASSLTGDTTVTFLGNEAGTMSTGPDGAIFAEIEGIQLGSGNDTVDASATTVGVVVDTGDGDDSILGGSGDDLIAGAEGSDTLEGGDGNDILIGDGGITNLIQNGSFEDTTGMTVTPWGYRGDDATAPGGWYTGTGGVIDIHNSGSGAPSDGSNWLDMEGVAGIDTVSQAVAGVIAGQSYTLSFDAIDAIGDNSVNVFWNGVLIDTVAPGSAAHQTYTYDLVGGSGDGSNILTFQSLGPIDMTGVAIDNVQLIGYSSLGDTAGDDLLVGGEGDDTLYGGGGEDTLLGGDGNDVLDAGTGADTVEGGAGDDLINLGNDGEADVIRFSDGDGSDTITGLDAPIDNGDGTFTGIDMLDVSGLTDANGAIVNTGDVTVTDTNGDGTGDAILTFPNGESLTLVGVSPATADNPAWLQALGIPAPNYIVSGTTGDDLIDASYTGDPQGDMVDANDAADGSNDDVIQAGAGDDTVLAGAGDDFVLGGLGADLLYGGDDNDTLVGNSGDDTIFGGAGDDLIVTGDDNNTFAGSGDSSSNVNLAYGGAGNDTLLGSVAADELHGDDGDDLLEGRSGNDTLYGGLGNDSLIGGADADTFIIEDGFGNDTIIGGETVTTGIDFDILDLSALTTGATVNLAGVESGTITDGVDTAIFSEIEAISLGGGRDALVLGAGSGSFTLIGFDLTDSGDGTTNDQLDVSGLTDLGGYPVNVADVTVTDTNGDGTGDAIISFPNGESITLVGVLASAVDDPAVLQAMGIPGIGPVDGTAGSDIMGPGYTDADGDQIDGTDGIDDTIFGNDGDDLIDGGLGNDTIYGGDGNDTLMGGSDGGADYLDGGFGDDEISAGDGDDTLLGGEGADSLFAGAGNDILSGGPGNDTLDGWSGNDTIDGGLGDDLITGGDGIDLFIYREGDGADTITDFNFGNTGTLSDGDPTNNDRIDLSGFYDNIWELHADHADDGILNQSNDGVGGVDYSDNLRFGTGSLTFLGATADNNSFTNENTGVICFASGTRILTDKGERLIETLRPGDRVLTRDNGYRPLLWLGARRLDAATLINRPSLRPIQIAAGAFGDHADLVLSPQHGVLLRLDGEERLFRAKHLSEMRGGKVRRMDGCRGVTYWHMLFEQHEVVFSEGLASESYYPGPDSVKRLDIEARAELNTLFPGLWSIETAEDAVQLYGAPARKYSRFKELPDHVAALETAL